MEASAALLRWRGALGVIYLYPFAIPLLPLWPEVPRCDDG